jgi:hypothetical protein
MAKPYIHALSSAKKHGGKPEDYMDIHNLMDSSKSTLADNRHRALTHNAWFIGLIIEKIFGDTRVNSDNKTYSVRDIAEEHVLEDFGGRFIPSAEDYLAEIKMLDWMNGGVGEPPPSYRNIGNHISQKAIQFEEPEKINNPNPIKETERIHLDPRRLPPRDLTGRGPALFD